MVDKLSSVHNQIRVLQKRWQTIAIVGSAIFALIFLGTLLATPIYEGTVQIIIERTESDNLSGTIRNQPKDPEFEKTQYQLILSHAVARRVVGLLSEPVVASEVDGSASSFKFVALIREVGGLFKRFVGQPEEESSSVHSETAWTKTDRLAARIAENVRVRPVQGSQITAVSYFSPNPEFAAQAANTYVKGYLEETLDMKLDATRRNLGWMTQKAEAERAKLQASEKRLQEFLVANNLLTIEDRVTILPEQFAELGRDLVQAEIRAREQKLLYDKVRAVADDPDAADSVLSTSESATLDLLRSQILRAEQSNMELASKYGVKHPFMLKAVADLNVLKEKRREEVTRIIQKVGNQYELARSNENSLRAQISMAKAEAMGLNEKYVQYSALKRELETNRQVYSALLTRIKDQSITGETRPVNIWIVENAKTPASPVRPMFMLNLILGLIVGLCCGVGSAFLVERLDNRIKSPDGLDEILGVPTLGSMTVKRRAEAMDEIVRTSPRSEYAESYNALRTTLLLSSANSPPQRLLVTSSIAGEGKSTTAVNLALAMARTGSKVLLIDADLRKPNLHKIFKLANKTGLSNFLAGSAGGQAVLCKGSHDNLIVIPAGPTPPNPYELLNSGRLALMLDNLKDEFDMIICDSPPVLSVSDPRVLSRYFDGVMLVVRADVATYQMVHKSIRMMQHVNARILGCFVNGVQAREQEYYRYTSDYLEETGKARPAGVKTA
jgi:capsular exopolysaccharide synthesis family protein